MADMKKCPIIQRVPCALHADRVAAICYRCHDLALEQQAKQYAAQRREAHKAYLAAQK
jgi:hypothetical protein